MNVVTDLEYVLETYNENNRVKGDHLVDNIAEKKILTFG